METKKNQLRKNEHKYYADDTNNADKLFYVYIDKSEVSRYTYTHQSIVPHASLRYTHYMGLDDHFLLTSP